MRYTEDLNRNWTFFLGDESRGETVCLPHPVTLTPANASGGRNYQGICRYEKAFFADKALAGKKVFLRFEGAMGRSLLCINGKPAAEHFCGYIPFVTDITEHLRLGEENEISIELDNTDSTDYPPGKTQGDLDFTYEGGLYRTASLVITEPVHITDPLLAEEVAGGGIFIHYEDVTAELAKLCVKTQVKNETETAAAIRVEHALLDADGNAAAWICCEDMLDAGNAVHLEGAAFVENPVLWDICKPHLYSLMTKVYVDGVLTDETVTKTGIRSVEFTLENGTLFNGISRRIVGANYHQTWPYIGNAVPLSLLKQDLLRLKDVGMENIRSHYPFDEGFVAFCDEIGMTMIVSNVGWQYCSYGTFFDRACHNMRQIIRWQRNHPAVILWEPIMNESAIDLEHQTILANIVKEEYPYPYSHSASDFGPTDVAYKEFDPVMLGKGMEEYGLVNVNDGKKRPRWVREYGDCPDNFVDQNTIWRTPRSLGDYAMVQAVERLLGRYDATETGAYTAVLNNPKNCGFGIWPGIEHSRGYHINPCWGGYFDLFRVQKFTGAFMKSQQDREKIGDYIFIANHWSTASPGDVTVYTNAEKVRLWHDEELVGEQEADDVPVKHPPFTFKDVRRRFKKNGRSTLRAEALADGKVVSEAVVHSHGVPKLMKLEWENFGMPLKADGADIAVIRCYVTDVDGNVVPHAADGHPVLFEAEGEGVIVGDGAIGANPVFPEGGIATVLIRTTQTPGEITVRAKPFWPQLNPNYIQFGGDSVGIREAELTIKSE